VPVGIPHFEAGEKVTKLSLEGRMDAAAILAIQPEFMAKTAALKKPVLVDMSQVTFMASLCIRMLVEAAKGLKVSGARLALLKPTPLVERALKASGFNLVVGIYHDEDTATQSLSLS
jgi:anti-anti-sigma factor